jgi:predicted permease
MMEWFNILMARLRALFRRESVLRDIEEELRVHVEMETETNIKRGMPPDEARAAALKSFGNLSRNTELGYDIRGGAWLETLWQDLRFGARMLLKQPSFTLIAVLTLALSIGANTAIFSVVNAVLLSPLPYTESDRLTLIWTSAESIGLKQNWVSEPEVLDFREQAKLFEGFGVINAAGFRLTGSGEPEQLNVARVSTNLFSLLGVRMKTGRDFAPDEEKPGAARVAILSHGFWQRRFGGEQAVIGSTIYLNGNTITVVGVLPAHFTLLLPPEAHVPADLDVWMPYAVNYAKQDRLSHGMTVIGRLKRGVPLAQAQAEMDAIAAKLDSLHYWNAGFGVKVVSMQADIVKRVRPALLALLGAVGFVLLITCANVANLLLARATAREKEIAIRTALGAGRPRVMRQLLTESVLLALLGGVCGLVLAMWGVDVLLRLSPPDLPRVEEVGINGWVLLFTLSLTALTGILFGLAPALQSSKTDLTNSLKDGSHSVAGGASHRLRNAVVVGEIALSLVLLIGAGLVMRSFWRLMKVDPGFDPHRILAMSLSLPGAKYPDGHTTENFYRQLLEKVQTLPGVESAAAISQLPLSQDYHSDTMTFEGVSANAERGNLASFEVDHRVATPDYLKVMKTPLLAGRFFTPQDVSEQNRVVVIDETLARRLWPNASPLGKRVTRGYFPEKPEVWFEIIGVVKQIRHHRLDADGREQVYFSHALRPRRVMTLAIRAASDPLNLIPTVRQAVRELDPDLPVYQIRTMEGLVANALAPARFTLLLLTIFAGVAGVLAIAGIYSVMAYMVTQRTHEIGVRMALGAQARDMLRLVMRQGVTLAVTGVAFGLIGSFALQHVMKGLLYGVRATDPMTFVVISLLLFGATLLACYVPARRATEVDPITALRFE